MGEPVKVIKINLEQSRSDAEGLSCVRLANSSPHPNILSRNLGYTERTMTKLASFARRLNEDHSVDSICITCYQTIAKDGDTTSTEQRHTCDPYGEFNQHQIDFRLACPIAGPSMHL